MDKTKAEKPKRVLRKTLGGFKYIKCPECGCSIQLDERYSEEREYCPNCGRWLDGGTNNYCNVCGQKIEHGRDD